MENRGWWIIMAGFDFSKIEVSDEVSPEPVEKSSGGFDFGQIETTEEPVSINKSSEAIDTNNSFEPMPEDLTSVRLKLQKNLYLLINLVKR